MIGLAARAGRVSAGEFSAEKALSSGKAKLCIIASDSSGNTKKHFNDMCHYRSIPVYGDIAEKTGLGHMIGKKDRAVITIDDENFSTAIIRIYEGERTNG